MENATQALLISAGVLIGIIILSMTVYLFSIFGDYAANTQSKIDANQIAQFNDKFLKYDGLTDLTIQDVITVKNYALENNYEDDTYDISSRACRAGNKNDYIDVYYAKTRLACTSSKAFILNKDDEELLKTEMQNISEGAKYNRLTCEVAINSLTGRVNKIYFYEIN